MNSNTFKRIVCFLLSLVMVLGVFPASVATAEAAEPNIMTADSNAPVGVTVSVGSSLITIDVNRVGESGTATNGGRNSMFSRTLWIHISMNISTEGASIPR